MPTIYEIDSNNIATGNSLVIGDAEGCPLGWTRTILPEHAPSQFVRVVGFAVEIFDEYPIPIPVPPTRDQLKAQREAAVAAIKVTTAAGNTFDGDEVSQGRMARAILALQATGTASTIWVLADNSVIQATAAELTEALVLAGQAQAAVWLIE